MNRTGIIVIQDEQGRESERYQVVYGAQLRVDGRRSTVEQGQVLLEWDPYTFSILTEEAGVGEVQGRHRRPHGARGSRRSHRPVAAHHHRLAGREEAAAGRNPRPPTAQVLRKYHMPSHAHLMVDDGEAVHAGEVLAKIPRETTKTKDITGGLPRVVELFEARKPRDTAAVISGDRRHRADGRRRQGPAQGHHRPRRAGRASSASTRCRAASTSTCRKASASRPAIR